MSRQFNNHNIMNARDASPTTKAAIAEMESAEKIREDNELAEAMNPFKNMDLKANNNNNTNHQKQQKRLTEL